MKKIVISLVLAVVLSPACEAEIDASSAAACVYKYSGEVMLLEPGTSAWMPLTRPVRLAEGARLKTGAKGSCQILAADGTLIDIGADSETVIETLKFEKARRDYGFSLLRGKIMWLVAKVTAQVSRLEVRTPGAVCAVRGTGFTTVVSSGALNVGLFDGKLDIRTQDKETALAPGSEAEVGAGPEVKVSDRFSKFMKAEERRYAKLSKYADGLRKKIAAREGFIDDFLKAQDKKLSDFELRKQGKIKNRG